MIHIRAQKSPASVVGRMLDLHRSFDSRLVGLFYGILVLKVVLLVVLLEHHPQALMSLDTPTYVEPAWSLLQDGRFATSGTPEILRTPGYPLFLALFLAVFGEAYGPAVAVVHFLLVGGTAGLAYAILRRVVPDRGHERAAKIGFGLVLIEPTLFLSEYNIGTEVLFTFLLTLGAYWLVRFLQEEGVSALLFGVLCLTASAYVRPIGLYLPFGLGAVGLAWFLFRRRWRTALAICFAASLHLALTSAWTIRNETHFGQRMFTTISHVNLFEYFGAAVKARAQGESWGDVREDFQEAWDRWEGNEAVKAVAAADSARKVLMTYPAHTGAVALRGFAATVLDPGTGSLANTLELRESDSGIIYRFVSMDLVDFGVYLIQNEVALVFFLGLGFLWLVFMWGTAIWGFVQCRIGPTHVLLILIIAYVIVLGSGPQSMARFRVPVVPLILVYSGLGTQSVVSRMRSR